MTRRVVVTDHVFDDLAIERSILEAAGVEVVEASSTDEDTLATLVSDADAVLVCYASITRRVIESAPPGRLTVIARYGIGYDNVDLQAAADAGVTVTHVPDYCIDEVADHTLALLLAASREVVASAVAVRDNLWGFPAARVHRLSGRTLALIGLGRIGVRVAERAHAFGLRLVAHDPFRDESPLPYVTLVKSLKTAVRDADFVSLHMPLTRDSRHIIDAETISWMTRAPVLINTARGGLVDLEAVMAALEDGSVSGVAVDVTDPEPLPVNHPLRRHPRAIVTPHTAFHSIEAEVELRRRATDEVLRALGGMPPRSPVPAPSPAARV